MKIVQRSSAVIGSLLVVGLAGCSSASGPSIATPEATGNKTIVETSGHGSADLGTFRAGGTLSVSASCIGSGTAKISFLSTGIVAEVACSQADGSTSLLANQAFLLPGQSTFQIKVAAGSSVRWSLGVASTR
jgi:hypothetical protein